MAMNKFQTISKSYQERLRSLLQDGYQLRHETRVGNQVICRLHHMANGNDIILHLDCDRYILTQKTNHILKHIVIA